MKQITKLFFVLILSFSFLLGNQKKTDNIAQISAVSLYNINKSALQETVKTYIKNYPNLKALKIVESLSGETYFQVYKKDGETVFEKEFPLDLKDSTILYESQSKYKDETVGQIFAYFKKQKSSILLTKEEELFLDKHPILKVGNEPDYAPWDFNIDGVPKGYSIDYMNLLASKIGIKVEYKLDTWGNLVKHLSSKNVDILHTMFKNDTRKGLIYSNAYKKVINVIFVNESNKDIKSLDDLANKTLSIPSGDSTILSLRKKFPKINISQTSGYIEAIKEVAFKKTDATILELGVANYLIKEYNIPNMKIVSEVTFKESTIEYSYRFGIRDDYKILASILNKAMKNVSSKELKELDEKWLKSDIHNHEQKELIKLTKAQTNWIKNNPKVKVIEFFDEPPFTINTEPKSGYMYELIEYLLDSSGLEIEYINNFSSYASMLENIQKGQSDILTTFPTSLNLGKESNIIKSKSVLQTPFVLIGKGNSEKINTINDLFGKKIAVVKGYEQDRYLDKFPKIDKLHVNNNIEGFTAIREGKADYYINNKANSEYILNKSFYTDLSILFELPYKDFPPLSISFAINGQKKELVSILETALNQIPYKKIKEIKNKWLSNKNSENKNSKTLELTQEEENWLKNQETLSYIYDSNWPPFEWENDIGQHTGMVSDVLKLIENKSGIKFTPSNSISWSEATNKLKNAKVAMASAISESNERKEYLNFTNKAIFTIPNVFITKEKTSFKNGFNSIGNKKIALIDGYLMEKAVKKDLPNLKYSTAKNVKEGLDKLLNNEIDIFVANLATAKYMLNQSKYEKLNISYKTKYTFDLKIALRKDYPSEALSIINKSLENISDEDLLKIYDKWFSKSISKNQEVSSSNDKLELTDILPIKELIIGFLVFLLIFYFIWKSQVNATNKDTTLKTTLFVIIGLFLFFASIITLVTLENIEKSQKNEVKESLKSVLNGSYKTIKIWVEAKFKKIDIVLNSKHINEKIANLQYDKNQKKEIKEHFDNFKEVFEDANYYLISKDLDVILSSQKDYKLNNIDISSVKNLITHNVLDRLIIFPSKKENEIEKNILFIKSIKDKFNKNIVFLIMKVDPKKEFIKILQNGKIGKSGETYAFNKNLELISNSRFDTQLKQIGLLKEEESFLNILIKDKDNNPTLLAKKAFENSSGVLINGYKDYRDITVYGSWIWDEELKIVFVSEIDENEAMGAFNNMKKTIIIIVFSIVLFTIFLTILTAWISTRSKKALEKSNKELNKLLNSFDENVISSTTNTKGIITHASKAFCKISGYKEKELIGQTQNIVRHPDTPKEVFKKLWETIQSGKTWKGELKNKKKDGSFYWVEAIIKPEFDDEDKIIGYSAIRQDITSKKEVQELSQSLEIKVEERTKQLQQNKLFLDSLLDSQEQIVITTDGKLLKSANKKFLDFFEIDELNDFIKDYDCICDKFKVDKTNTYLQKYMGEISWIDYILSNEKTQHKVIIQKNDKDRIFSVTAAIMPIENGDIKSAVFTEITELEIQKKQTETILSSVLLPMLITSKETRKIVYANSFAEKQYETTLDELIGLDIEIFYTYEKQRDDILQEMQEKGSVQNFETRFKTLKDNNFDALLSLVDITFEGQECFLGVAIDITEQKNRELEIKRQQMQMETLVDAIPSVIFMKDKKGKHLLVNDFYTEVTGIKKELVIGKTDFEVMPHEIAKQITDIDKEVMESGIAQTYEESVPHLNGETKHYVTSKVPLIEQNKDVYGMVGIATDITASKELQKEIEQINKHTKESIEYASLIQHALIPDNNIFKKYFSDYLTIWHPKDIVGGDIYLFEELRDENECLIMVIDCTGHGVPGAFVTMLVKAIERQITSNIINSDEEVSPAKILTIFNKSMKHLLKQENDESISNAGFDGGILYYNKKERIIKFSGAETPLFYIEDGELKTIKGNRHSVGYKKSDANFKFKEHTINVKEGMQFYITTDGYLDQNGGEKGFPFGKRRFSKIIEDNSKLAFADQQEVLLYELMEYQGNEEKNDDITIVGIKIDKEEKKSSLKEEQILWNI